MNLVNSRQLKILIDLCHVQNRYLTADFFAKKHSVSIRTIQNDIVEIRNILENYEFVELVSIPSKGNQIVIHDEQKMQAFIDEESKSFRLHNLNSRKERVNKIIALFFATKKYMSIQHMADRLFVSKSTFINDLKNAKKILEKYNISILNKPQKGLYMVAEETDVRLCIVKENIDVFSVYNEFMVLGQMSDNLMKIGEILVGLLVDNKYRISDVALQNLIVHVDIIVWRIRIGFFLEEIHDEEIENDFSLEINLAREIFEECRKSFGIQVIDSEVKRLAVYLRGKSDYTDNSYITQEIDEFVLDTLNVIKQKFGIDFIDNVQLRISLSLHLMPLLTRLKYNMQLRNELLNDVKKSYQLAFDIASTFAYRIQEVFGYKLIEDEIAYFAIYFSSSLILHQEHTGNNSILIISSLKRSETLLLRERINSWFSDAIAKLTITNVYDLEEIAIEEYSVICTTEKSRCQETSNTILISQFPTEEDYRKIKMAMDGFNSKEDIIGLFKEDLIFRGQVKNKEKVISILCEYIEKYEGSNEISIKEEVLKREAFGGTYYGNKVAIPHALYPVTKKTHIAVALLENGIVWDDNENEVRIVFLVCIEKDNPKAFQIWAYLSEFIVNEKLIHSLLEDTSFENIRTQLSQALTISKSASGFDDSIFSS